MDEDRTKTSGDERADKTDANPSRTSAPPTRDYPGVTAFRVLTHSTWLSGVITIFRCGTPKTGAEHLVGVLVLRHVYENSRGRRAYKKQ